MEIVIDFEDLGQNIELTMEKDYGNGTGSIRKIIIPKDVIKGILESLEENS